MMKIKQVLKKWWYLFLAVGILIIGIIIAIFATAKTEGGVGQAGISNEWENEETYNKCVEKIS